eukprot:gene322-3691_t
MWEIAESNGLLLLQLCWYAKVGEKFCPAWDDITRCPELHTHKQTAKPTVKTMMTVNTTMITTHARVVMFTTTFSNRASTKDGIAQRTQRRLNSQRDTWVCMHAYVPTIDKLVTSQEHSSEMCPVKERSETLHQGCVHDCLKTYESLRATSNSTWKRSHCEEELMQYSLKLCHIQQQHNAINHTPQTAVDSPISNLRSTNVEETCCVDNILRTSKLSILGNVKNSLDDVSKDDNQIDMEHQLGTQNPRANLPPDQHIRPQLLHSTSNPQPSHDYDFTNLSDSVNIHAIAPSTTEGLFAHSGSQQCFGHLVPNSLLEGFMLKQPSRRLGLSTRYKKRYFVLTRAALSYYDYQFNKLGQLKGTFPIYEILEAKVHASYPEDVVVFHGSGVLRCRTECEEESLVWIEAINTCVRTALPQGAVLRDDVCADTGSQQKCIISPFSQQHGTDRDGIVKMGNGSLLKAIMQHDQIIWNIISQNFCSFKTTSVRADKEKLLVQKNMLLYYEVTYALFITEQIRKLFVVINIMSQLIQPFLNLGLCNRRSCPLANSNYATIREHNGRIYLCIKTVERAHTPRNMWEKIKLKQNFEEALRQIDQHLAYWPSFLKLKCKQRLTKITQYLIRMRKLTLKPQPKLLTRNKKVERRESRRELKALRAAHINKVIEKELLDRLKQGTYEGVYNFPEGAFNNVMDKEGEEDKDIQDADTSMLEADEFIPEYEEEEDDKDEEENEIEDYDMERGLDDLFQDDDDEEEDDDDGGDNSDEVQHEEGDGENSTKRSKSSKEDRNKALASAAAMLLRYALISQLRRLFIFDCSCSTVYSIFINF